VKPTISGQSSSSFEAEIYLDKLAEYTQAIDFRQRIPFYDRPSSFSTATNDLKESFISLSHSGGRGKVYHFVNWEKRSFLSSPQGKQKILVINCSEFPSMGPEAISGFVAQAYELGWKKFITFDWRGQINCGCGLGPRSNDVRIDVYGIPGDGLASDLDGAEIAVHGSAGNRVGQKMESGRLVIYGDVGLDFMERAKGGKVYVLGNVSGRPLTYSSGSPRIVINGTFFEKSDETTQSINPSKNSGFVILNGLTFNEKGEIEDMESPYSEKSLLSLAKGRTVYFRDPLSKIKKNKLIEGRSLELNETDCLNIFHCLKENERLFQIGVLDLISVKKQLLPFHKVYKKIESIESHVCI
jgi:hypothetical protein